MTIEQIVMLEIASGRNNVRRISESRLMFQRADIVATVKRLIARGLIERDGKRRYFLTSAGQFWLDRLLQEAPNGITTR